MACNPNDIEESQHLPCIAVIEEISMVSTSKYNNSGPDTVISRALTPTADDPQCADDIPACNRQLDEHKLRLPRNELDDLLPTFDAIAKSFALLGLSDDGLSDASFTTEADELALTAASPPIDSTTLSSTYGQVSNSSRSQSSSGDGDCCISLRPQASCAEIGASAPASDDAAGRLRNSEERSQGAAARRPAAPGAAPARPTANPEKICDLVLDMDAASAAVTAALTGIPTGGQPPPLPSLFCRKGGALTGDAGAAIGGRRGDGDVVPPPPPRRPPPRRSLTQQAYSNHFNASAAVPAIDIVSLVDCSYYPFSPLQLLPPPPPPPPRPRHYPHTFYNPAAPHHVASPLPPPPVVLPGATASTTVATLMGAGAAMAFGLMGPVAPPRPACMGHGGVGGCIGEPSEADSSPVPSKLPRCRVSISGPTIDLGCDGGPASQRSSVRWHASSSGIPSADPHPCVMYGAGSQSHMAPYPHVTPYPAPRYQQQAPPPPPPPQLLLQLQPGPHLHPHPHLHSHPHLHPAQPGRATAMRVPVLSQPLPHLARDNPLLAPAAAPQLPQLLLPPPSPPSLAAVPALPPLHAHPQGFADPFGDPARAPPAFDRHSQHSSLLSTAVRHPSPVMVPRGFLDMTSPLPGGGSGGIRLGAAAASGVPSLPGTMAVATTIEWPWRVEAAGGGDGGGSMYGTGSSSGRGGASGTVAPGDATAESEYGSIAAAAAGPDSGASIAAALGEASCQGPAAAVKDGDGYDGGGGQVRQLGRSSSAPARRQPAAAEGRALSNIFSSSNDSNAGTDGARTAGAAVLDAAALSLLFDGEQGFLGATVGSVGSSSNLASLLESFGAGGGSSLALSPLLDPSSLSLSSGSLDFASLSLSLQPSPRTSLANPLAPRSDLAAGCGNAGDMPSGVSSAAVAAAVPPAPPHLPGGSCAGGVVGGTAMYDNYFTDVWPFAAISDIAAAATGLAPGLGSAPVGGGGGGGGWDSEALRAALQFLQATAQLDD